MNRAKIQDYIDQREEQRSLIYHIEEKDQTHFTVNGHPYELVKDYRDGFNSEKFAERFSSVLSKYDYIVGDWGYDQLRLKGFMMMIIPYLNQNWVLIRLKITYLSIVILAVRILSFTMMMFVFHGTVTVSVERKLRQSFMNGDGELNNRTCVNGIISVQNV